MDNILEVILSSTFIFSIIRSTTPILLGALGSVISENIGMTNIGIDGMMLSAAFTGVVISAMTNSAWVGLIGAVIVGVLLGILLAFVHLKLDTDLMLAGVALNLLATSGTALLLFLYSGDRTVSTKINSEVLPNVRIPFIHDIPVVGDILSGHNVLTYIALIMIVIVTIFIYNTKTGLRIRSIGESNTIVESMGIDTVKYKYLALALGGLFAGLGGAFLSMGYVSFFTTSLVSGKGTIALASSIMGSGSPLLTSLAAFLFGTADALSLALSTSKVSTYIINMLPYALTIISLSIRSKKEFKSQTTL